MTVAKSIYITAFMSMSVLLATSVLAKEAAKPKYSAKVPLNILTPDKVETELLGDLYRRLYTSASGLRRQVIFWR